MIPRLGAVMTAALVVLVVAPAGGAEAKLPLGEADGVRVHRERGALVVTFTARAARLFRRVAGRRISVICTEMAHESGPGEMTSSSGGVTMRAPKRRRPIRTGDLTRGMDYCRVWLEPRTVRRQGSRMRLGREPIVAVPLTPRGAEHLDLTDKAAALVGLLALAGVVAEKENSTVWPAPAELLAFLSDLRGFRHEVVALASPGDSPPPGALGYYSDGRQHAAAVILSAAGRRLFLEFDADDVVRTNVAGYVFSDLE